MDNFDFENDRNKLSDELKESRKKAGGRGEAKKTLTEAKRMEKHQVSGKLHHVAKGFPKEAVEEAVTYPERVDDPVKWDVEDVYK